MSVAAALGGVGMAAVELAASVRVWDLAFEGIEDIAAVVGVEVEVGMFEAVVGKEVFVVEPELVVRLVRRLMQEHLCRQGP